MCTLDSFSSVLACHAIKKSRKRVEESRTKLLLSVLLIFKWICFIGYFGQFFTYMQNLKFLIFFCPVPLPPFSFQTFIINTVSILMNSWQFIFHEEDETRSRLKFVAVCVARRLITLPAHVSLSGSICPHDIKPFATREFCNWLIRLVSFSFFYVTISDNFITPNANNRTSLFINHSVLSIHH